jgi:hypothetical protein
MMVEFLSLQWYRARSSPPARQRDGAGSLAHLLDCRRSPSLLAAASSCRSKRSPVLDVFGKFLR